MNAVERRGAPGPVPGDHATRWRSAVPGRFARCCALALLLLTLSTASASAEGVWWGLTSGTRPGHLQAGAGHAGQPNVQEIIANLEGGDGAIELNVGSTELGFFVYPESLAVEDGFPTLNAADLQTALEGPYGVGRVTVTEHIEGEVLSFKVDTPGGSATLSANDAGIGTAESKVTSVGTAATPDGEVYVTAENLGDQSVSGASSPITISDVLPSGLKAVAIEATKPPEKDSFASKRPQISCTLATLSCTLGKGQSPLEALAPYDELEMRIAVDVEPGAAESEPNEVRISGGEGFTCRADPGAGSYRDSGCMDESLGSGFERSSSGPVAAASSKRTLTISPSPSTFGVDQYTLANEEEGGTISTQAGAHPFQQTTTLTFNQGADLTPPGSGAGERHVNAIGLPKDANFKWPAGLIGNPTPIAQCTDVQFFAHTEGSAANLCPPDSAVGVATVTVNEPTNLGVSEITVPLFNLVPRVGEPARFGFNVTEANAPVTIDTSVRTGGDYGITVSADNVTQSVSFLSSSVTVWGVPGSSSHDRQRGWSCLLESRGFALEPMSAGGIGPCSPAGEAHPAPFLSLPTSCEGTLHTSVLADQWSEPGNFHEFPGNFDEGQSLDSCNRLPFSAEIKLAPDSQSASTPTGLKVDVHVPQEEDLNAAGPSSSNIKDINVVLPKGVVLNPAAADGLEACSEEQIGYLSGQSSPPSELHFTETLPEPLLQGSNFCPDAAKVGTAKISTPLLPKGDALEGAVYLAAPAPNAEEGQNPFKSLVAMYIVAKDPVSGALVKLPGRVSLNQETGQIESSSENTPSSPSKTPNCTSSAASAPRLPPPPPAAAMKPKRPSRRGLAPRRSNRTRASRSPQARTAAPARARRPSPRLAGRPAART